MTIDRHDAKEFSEAFGQIGSGWWRQVAWAHRQGIPAALGLGTEEWVEKYVGGHMRLRIDERRDAVAELTEGGLSTREIGEVIGVDHSTIVRDRNGGADAPGLTDELSDQPDRDAVGGANAPAKFNRVNDNIGWARWSWNPVTGCLHNCDYCYARDIAERFYPQKFEPTFLPERLDAPANTQLPKTATDDPEWRRVFTCSMADLFGKWVPQEWIDAVFNAIDQHRQWEYLCLTKFPQRLAQLEWPDNVWAGTTVDRQHRVAVAERAFDGVKAGVKWLSCEPLLEPLQFESLEMFDWVVIGASTGSTHVAPFAPPFDWVVDLYEQARAVGCRVYLKHNLFASQDGRGPGMQPIREWPR